MKILNPVTGGPWQVSRRHRPGGGTFDLRPSTFDLRAAFTMIEIAICLAIIGIALVAIVGVLPLGMNVQRENRESTIINQDATVLMEAIRNGSRGLDDLTNYVYFITNNWALYNSDGTVKNSGGNGYTYSSVTLAPSYISTAGSPIYNGTNIVGLLSTPEFTDVNGAPINNFLAAVLPASYYSNHIVAYVRSISGPAVEKPPQDNSILQEDSFSYHLYCVNAPVAADTNFFSLPFNQQAYSQRLAQNLHELRLTFLWPQLPNGKLGTGRQTYRALVAGQVATNIVFGNFLYFYQPQSFAINP
jgi:prepilin-type N-terminal cleavage/methylation domain-containing protein